MREKATRRSSKSPRHDFIKLEESPSKGKRLNVNDTSTLSRLGSKTYAGAGYFDAFVIGFLQPGWPAFLCTFILQVMAPFTLGAYIFAAACLLAGFLHMGIKYFSDHVERNSSRINTLQTLTKSIDKELKEMTITKSKYVTWLMEDVCQNTMAKDNAHSYHRLTEHLGKYHKQAPVYITQEQIDAVVASVKKTRQHNQVGINSAEKLASLRAGQFVMYTIAALIVGVGMAGLLFFCFLTTNAAITPLIQFVSEETVKNIALGVAAVASGWGVFKLIDFCVIKHNEYKSRNAAVQTLRNLDLELQASLKELEAIHVREQELTRAYSADQKVEVRPKTFAKAYDSSTYNPDQLDDLLASKTKDVVKGVGQVINPSPIRRNPQFIYGKSGKQPIARSLADDFNKAQTEIFEI